MRLTLLVFFCLFISVMGLPTGYNEIKEYFHEEGYTGTYLRKNVRIVELEETARNVFREFLKTADNAQKDRIESYLEEWKKVYENNGPFETEKQRDDAFSAISSPSHFQASTLIEYLLDNRDDSSAAKEAFKAGMITGDTTALQLYYTGDGDIISGLMIVSLKKNGEAVFIAILVD